MRLRFFLLIVMMLVGTGFQGSAQNKPRPQVIVIVCSGLTFDDLHLSDDAFPHLAGFVERGTTGLMNCAVNGEKTDVAAKLTLAIGKQSPAEPTDGKAGNDWELLQGETQGVGAVFHRLTGLTPNSKASIKHLGINSLQSRGLSQNRLGAALASATPPVKTWIVGNSDRVHERLINAKIRTETLSDRSSTLLTLDSTGVGSGMIALHAYDSRLPYGLTDSAQSLIDYALQRPSDFTVIELGNLSRAEAARPQIATEAYVTARKHGIALLDNLIARLLETLKKRNATVNILLVSPRPPASDAKDPQNWNRLTPIVGWGPDFPPGRFISDTTRTPGIVANSDFAPTILSLFDIAAPASMVGKPLRVEKDDVFIDPEFKSKFANRLADLNRLDFLSNLNDRSLVPALFFMGVCTVLFILGGLAALRTGNTGVAKAFSGGLIFIMNAPGAFMLASIQLPPTVPEHLIRSALISGLLTLICFVSSRLAKFSPALLCCLLNTVLILADLLTGQTLLKESLLSNYYIGGFRYYGIGNEYLGVLLAFALGGGFLWMDESRIPSNSSSEERLARKEKPLPFFKTPNAILLSLFWVGLSFALGWSAFGANSGSLVVTTASFGLGITLLCGRKPGWGAGALLILLGLGLSFLFAWLDLKFSGAQASHAGMALKSASGGQGWYYLLEIILRKTLLNLRLLVAPWTLFTAFLITIAISLVNKLGSDKLARFWLRFVWFAKGRTAAALAIIAAILFKDTGVVTVCYLVGFLTALLVSALCHFNAASEPDGGRKETSETDYGA